ncbi:hypothetical protein [Bradyrhizobium erythrophlei]|uniref:Uncharacterized protein n=1 Tax=Bradyrhizobium erythrophlei TaxID=1437360 RepID=A0A1M7TER1_9BRAD|nr:hypothetical protein [Bradyrhizobium erythrophlei]SHN69186.1 hypothetical protein SAMN05444170_1509 [Bradyrhizobium erythrophlei]
MAKATSTSTICESHLHVQTDLAELREAGVRPLFHFFCFLVSLDEELRARDRSTLPIYTHRDRNDRVWFRVDRGPRIAMPSDPTSPEFDRAYHAALVDAGEQHDLDDWSELRRFHAEQKRARIRA